MQESKSFCSKLADKKIDPCRVSTGPAEASDKSKLDGISGNRKHDRNGRSRRLGGEDPARSQLRLSPPLSDGQAQGRGQGADWYGLTPSGIRSRSSCLRQSPLRRGPFVTRPDARGARWRKLCRGSLSPASPAVAPVRARGHATAAPPSSVMKSRRLMLTLRTDWGAGCAALRWSSLLRRQMFVLDYYRRQVAGAPEASSGISVPNPPPPRASRREGRGLGRKFSGPSGGKGISGRVSGTLSHMLNHDYLAQSLRRPLPTKDGGHLRRVADAANYIVASPTCARCGQAEFRTPARGG